MHPLIADYNASLEEVLTRLLAAEEVYVTLMTFAAENSFNGGNNSPVDRANHSTTCDSGVSNDGHLEMDEEQFFLQNDLDSIKQLMLSHDQFLQEMVEYETRIKEVLTEGKALIESGYPSIEERNAMIQQRSLLTEKFSSLYRTVCNKQARLNDALILLERKQMDNLRAWLIYAEDKIAEFEEIGPDLESLNRQIEDQRIFQEEIVEQQELVDTLTTLIGIMESLSGHALNQVKDSSDSAVGNADLLDHSDLEDQLQALSEKWSTVCRFVEERGSILLFITKNLQMLQDEEGRFNQWISSLDRRLEAIEKAVAESEIGSTFVSELMKRLQRLEQEMELEHIHYSSAVEEGQRLLDRLEKNSPIWHEINNKLERLTDIWDVRVQQIENLGLALTNAHSAQRQHMQQQRQMLHDASRTPSNEKAQLQNGSQHRTTSQCNDSTLSGPNSNSPGPSPANSAGPGSGSNKKVRLHSWRVKEWQRDMEDISTFLGRMEDDLGLDDEGNGAVVWEELAIEEQQILLEDTERAIEDRHKEIDELIAEGKQIIDEMKSNGNQVKQLQDINQAVEERWQLVKEELDRKRVKVRTVTELHKFNCEAESMKRALASHQKWLQGAETCLETETDLHKLEDQTRLRNRSMQYQKKKVDKIKEGIELICNKVPQMSENESIRDIKYFINFWESVNERSNQLQEKIKSKSCELKATTPVTSEEEKQTADEAESSTDAKCSVREQPSQEDDEEEEGENTNDAKASAFEHPAHDSDVEYDEMTSHPHQIVLPSRASGVYEVHQVVHADAFLHGEDNPAYTGSSDDEAKCESPLPCVQEETKDSNECQAKDSLAKNTDGSLDQLSHDLDDLMKSYHLGSGQNKKEEQLDQSSSQIPKSHEAIANSNCKDTCNEEKGGGASGGGGKNLCKEAATVNTSLGRPSSIEHSPKCSLPTSEKASEKVIYDVPQTFYRKVNIDSEKSIESHDRSEDATSDSVCIQSNFISSIESNELRSTLQQPFGDAKSNSESSSSPFPASDHSTPLDPKEATEMDLSNSKQVRQSHEQISSPSTSNEDASYEKSVQASQNAPLYANNMSEGESEWEYRANPSSPVTGTRKDSFSSPSPSSQSNKKKQQQEQALHPPAPSSHSNQPSKHSSVMYHLDSSSSSRSSVSPTDQNEMEKHREPSVIVLRRSGNNACENLIIKHPANGANRSGSRGDSSISSSESGTTNCHQTMHMTLDTPVAASTSSSFSVPRPLDRSHNLEKSGTFGNMNCGMIQHSLLAVATDAPFERSIIPSNHVPYYIDHASERTQWDHPVMSHLMASLVELNEIRFSAYRTGLKLKEVRKHLCLDLVPLALLVETFDRYGLRAQNDRLLSVPEMVTCLQSIFETAIAEETISRERALMKVPLVIDLTLNWLLNLFDTASRTGFVRVLSFKVALVTLCDSSLLDKYKFMFRLIADKEGFTDARKFGLLLHDLIQIPRFLGEAAYFGGSNIEPSVRSCFTRSHNESSSGKNSLKSEIETRDFLSWLHREPQSLVWLSVMHRLAAAESVVHQVKCNICKSYPITGLRYRCLRCFNFDSCQTCFLTDKVAVKHNSNHPMQEYCLPTSSGKDLSDFSRILRNKLVKRSKKSPKFGYLPVQTVLEGDDLESPSMSHISSPEYDLQSISSPDSPIHQVTQPEQLTSHPPHPHAALPPRPPSISPHLLSPRPPLYSHQMPASETPSFSLSPRKSHQPGHSVKSQTQMMLEEPAIDLAHGGFNIATSTPLGHTERASRSNGHH